VNRDLREDETHSRQQAEALIKENALLKQSTDILDAAVANSKQHKDLLRRRLSGVKDAAACLEIALTNAM
jgi:hypothetical protein